jgi:acetyltransferase-like isoleucine patch superfamily enzyme
MTQYFTFIFNYLRYKWLFLKAPKKFYLDKCCKIIGAQNIVLGENFGANRFLRMEAFGNKNDEKIVIGKNVSFGESVHIGATNKIIIGDNVLLGSRILIIDHNHGQYSKDRQCSPLSKPSERPIYSDGPIIIEENVWIGDGVVVLPNSKIGKGSIIGANSVVLRDVEAFTICSGNPLKIIKRYNFSNSTWEKINK